MKILFLNWLRWTYPKNNNALKDYLRERGVECIEMQPCEIGHCNRALLGEIPERLATSSYRGFNVDSMIQTEATMDAGWYNPDKRYLIKYRKWVMYLIDWAFETFEKEKPDYIVVEGGLTYLARPMVEVAREMGIGIIAIENSFIKDKIFIEFNTGAICNRHSFARISQDWIDTRALTRTQRKEVNKIIKNVFKNLNYTTKGTFDFNSLPYQKTVFVPLQVYADQVTLYDSKFNNETFTLKILELAKKEFKDWNVILKCHPKEERNKPKATGDWLEKQNLSKNVILIRGAEDSANTQEFMKHSDLIFVNNSQAGLEACLLEKSVIVFGDAFYANKGFTLEYSSSINWNKVKENPEYIMNVERMKTWFLYFYKWLFSRQLTDSDKLRIKKSLNLRG